jgi:hypothetical protein
LPAKGSTKCNCGNVEAEWVDSARGTARVRASNRNVVRIIGLHNLWLGRAYAEPSVSTSDEKWRECTDSVVRYHSDGTLFASERRACPVVIFRVGETGDVWWWEEETA